MRKLSCVKIKILNLHSWMFNPSEFLLLKILKVEDECGGGGGKRLKCIFDI